MTSDQTNDRVRVSDRLNKAYFCSARLLRRAVIVTSHGATMSALLFAMLAGSGTMAQAQKESVLYSFCSMPNCTDGFGPIGNLAIDAEGNLYGATSYGGRHCCGTLFELAPSGAETVRVSFSDADGAYPNGGMIWDAKGNLYGTTAGATDFLGQAGGFFGSVFELEKRSFRFRYRFTGNLANGAKPPSGLAMDAQGNLYGTTTSGGNVGCFDFGCGTVFKLAPDGTETVLHNFSGGADGGTPYGSLVLDAEGNLYGTTYLGGNSGAGCNSTCGTVFKVTPDGTETVLYGFGGGNDGANPVAGLVMDGQGNLYGTTLLAGAHGNGTAFKVTPGGAETVLYTFAGGTDGSVSYASLLLDAKGNLYGTTAAGGGLGCRENGGCGTVFKVTPEGTEKVLHRFTGGTDGAEPYGGLVFDGKGNLYGTTLGGGGGKGCYDNLPGCGVVFKVTL